MNNSRETSESNGGVAHDGLQEPHPLGDGISANHEGIAGSWMRWGREQDRRSKIHDEAARKALDLPEEPMIYAPKTEHHYHPANPVPDPGGNSGTQVPAPAGSAHKWLPWAVSGLLGATTMGALTPGVRQAVSNMFTVTQPGVPGVPGASGSGLKYKISPLPGGSK